VNGDDVNIYGSGNAIGIVSPMEIYNNVFVSPYTNGLPSYGIKNTWGAWARIYNNMFLCQRAIEGEGGNDEIRGNFFFVKTKQAVPTIYYTGASPAEVLIADNVFDCEGTAAADAHWIQMTNTAGASSTAVFNVRNNKFIRQGIRIALQGLERIFINNNTFLGGGQTAVKLNITGTNNAGIRVIDNLFYENGVSQLTMGAFGDPSVHRLDNMVFKGNRGITAGFTLNHKGTNVVIEDNRFDGETAQSYSAIVGSNTSTNWTIRNNYFGKRLYLGIKHSVIDGNETPILDLDTYFSGCPSSEFRFNKYDILLAASDTQPALFYENRGQLTNLFHNVATGQYVITNGNMITYSRTNTVPTWNGNYRTIATDTNAPVNIFVLTNDGGANTGWYPK